MFHTFLLSTLPFSIFPFYTSWLCNAGVHSCSIIFLGVFCKSWKSDNVASWGHRYLLWSTLELMSLSLFSICQICVCSSFCYKKFLWIFIEKKFDPVPSLGCILGQMICGSQYTFSLLIGLLVAYSLNWTDFYLLLIVNIKVDATSCCPSSKNTTTFAHQNAIT